jgi:hypothetical protein
MDAKRLLRLLALGAALAGAWPATGRADELPPGYLRVAPPPGEGSDEETVRERVADEKNAANGRAMVATGAPLLLFGGLGALASTIGLAVGLGSTQCDLNPFGLAYQPSRSGCENNRGTVILASGVGLLASAVIVAAGAALVSVGRTRLSIAPTAGGAQVSLAMRF